MNFSIVVTHCPNPSQPTSKGPLGRRRRRAALLVYQVVNATRALTGAALQPVWQFQLCVQEGSDKAPRSLLGLDDQS
jgi:hypothetical protein